ncbi:MAG: hypothetical protein ABI758_00855 [Candidatus Woesebacteria bacterium]
MIDREKITRYSYRTVLQVLVDEQLVLPGDLAALINLPVKNIDREISENDFDAIMSEFVDAQENRDSIPLFIKALAATAKVRSPGEMANPQIRLTQSDALAKA